MATPSTDDIVFTPYEFVELLTQFANDEHMGDVARTARYLAKKHGVADLLRWDDNYRLWTKEDYEAAPPESEGPVTPWEDLETL